MVKEENKQIREPLGRLWFLGRGYTPIDPEHVYGRILYIRVKGKEVSILNAYGGKVCIRLLPNKQGSINSGGTNFYYFLQIWSGGRIKHIPISFIVMAALKHKVPDRSKKQVIDHIDGDTLNNNPNNLRIVSREINDRDGGFMRKLRNNGIIVAMFPTNIILAGYERMAEWRSTHTRLQYEHLRGAELRQVFFGPKYIVVDPTIAAAEEPDKYV